MNKVSIRIVYVFLCIVLLILLQCSSDNLSGGSGAETGNARVAGVIVNASGHPVPDVQVLLYPVFYNPVTDTPPGYPYVDTTDLNGKYNFNVPDNGKYNVLAKEPLTGDRSIVNVTVTEEPVVIPVITLLKTGVIKVIFSADNPMKRGTLCLIGSPISVAITDKDISAGYTVMDTIPEGTFSELYFLSENNRYGVSITTQINVKRADTTTVNVCLCELEAMGYDANPPAVFTTQYVSFSGQELKRYAWKGNHIALLTKDSTLDPCIVRRMIAVLDSAYHFNSTYCGQLPPLDRNYNGLLSIAEVPYATIGLFNGALGVSGVEMGEDQFERFYNLVSLQNSFPQELFFVFANNFNFYLNKLTYSGNPKYAVAVSRGFSVFMRFITMKGIGVKAAPINNMSFDQYYNKIVNLMDLYCADSSLSFSSAFAVDTLPFENLKSEHLFASMLLRVGKLYGDSVLAAVWKEVDKRPVATSTQAAIDNLVLAFSSAAGVNLIPLFTGWRLPVSESAKTEAAKKFQ